VKINADNLQQQLDSAFSPVYLIAGDEPLLVTEACDAVRAAARSHGYDERTVMVAERGFDWDSLNAAGSNMSLFGEKCLLELRLPTGKPGQAGARALLEYVEEPPQDTALLIISARLDRTAQKSKWVKALSSAGVFCPIYNIDEKRLPGWISARMRAAGLDPDREAVALLADRVEGNLLAAQQEIEKLLLLDGPGKVDIEAVRASVGDSSRFDVFQLADAAVGGDLKRCLRVLSGLRQEGVEPVLVSWALVREIRSLAGLAHAVSRGTSIGAAMASAHIWQSRQSLFASALRRHDLASAHMLVLQAAQTDATIKGARRGDAWACLQALSCALAAGTATPLAQAG
jgi:DNA polymerase-3 subunit delta